MASILNVFQAAGDGACGVSAQQRIVLWNRAAETILGYGSSEVLGRRCYEVFRGSDERNSPVCQRCCPIFRMVQGTDAAPTAILRVNRKDGDEAWLSMSTLAIPSRWNVTTALVHLFRDVSWMKTCEIAIDDLVTSVLPARGRSEEASNESSVPNPTSCLTERENQVLRLLAAGQSTQAIAKLLFVSPSTVRNHVHNILAKLDVHSRLEAVTTALRFHLV